VTEQRDDLIASRSNPTADPTDGDTRQVAVALKHDRADDRAPRVVATGRGALAERILELAFAAGVKVREDADLAEILAAIEADEEIPVAAFAAVAEILSYVYRANLEDMGEQPAE
jgi:flagellar biosynthesis protein